MFDFKANFTEYVLGFYGKGGIYDYGFTKEEVEAATDELIRKEGEDEFEGDSRDREHVRDYVFEARAAKEAA